MESIARVAQHTPFTLNRHQDLYVQGDMGLIYALHSGEVTLHRTMHNELENQASPEVLVSPRRQGKKPPAPIQLALVCHGACPPSAVVVVTGVFILL